MATNPERNWTWWWHSWGKPSLCFLALVFLVRSTAYDLNRVPSGSMQPTLLVGDRVAVNRLAYGLHVPFTSHWLARWDLPRCGQVIVFFLEGFNSLLVKRVIGVPGDTIEMRANQLIINGQPIPCESEESPPDDLDNELRKSERIGLDWHPILVSKTPSSSQSFGPIVVPDGHYFVMGDNRDRSKDSRVFGFVPVENIVGQATAVVFSLDPASRNFPRAQRFCRAVP